MAAEVAISQTSADLRNASGASSDDQLMEIWLHGRSVHTQRAYRADVDQFRSGAGKPLAGVTLADLQQFADSLSDLQPATRYRKLSSLKSLLAFGHRIGYLPFDVGRVLRLPAVRNRLVERILPEADLHRILNLEPDPRNRAVITLLYASGVRVSELCGLCWRDLQPDGEAGQITVFGKRGLTRAIQLPASVWKLLQRLRATGAAADAPVFGSRKRKSGTGFVLRPCFASSARRPFGPALKCRYRPTGSGMRTLRTRSIGGRLFIWCKPP